jgi:amino acid adenylation domain-containing protein
VFLERMPLLPNGKIDRNNLPQPGSAIAAPELANRQPRNEIQNLLKTLWEQVLGLSSIDARANFFEIGGHSLIATRIVSRVREQFKLELSLRALFENPTIEEFSAYINEQIRVDRDKPQPKIPRVSGQRKAPLSYSQQRLWFLEQMESGTDRYNLGTGIRLKGNLRLSALEQSFREVIRRHEILRTRFEETDGIPLQIIEEAFSFSIGIRDLSKLPDNRRRELGDLLMKEELHRGFNLAALPLIRATVVKEADEENALLLTMHHIITDGWSVMVMIDEVVGVYEQILNGEQIQLDELELQYSDYARWQRDRVEGEELQSQLDYWKEKLANLPDQLDLPSDWPRAARAGFRGARRAVKLSRELSAQIRGGSQERHATVNMFLLAGLNLLLSRLTGETDLVVGVPIAGRNRKEIEKLIGFFINSLALRTNLRGGATFEELLRHVKETLLEAYSSQDLPFELVLEELQPVRDPSRTPLFQVFFNMLNFGQWSLNIPGLDASILTTPEPASNFDLTLYVNDYEEEIAISLVYNTRLFSEERIIEMLEQYRYLLSQAAESPQRLVNDYSLVTDTARLSLPDPAEKLDDTWFGAVHTLFARQAGDRPQQPAVIDRNEIWSYSELDERSNQLANHLIMAGIRSGDVVAIYAHRSGSLPWAVIGVLKAGAAFLLLDPSYPASRLIDYLELAEPRGWLQLETAGAIPVKLRNYLAGGALRASLSIPSRSDATAQGFLAGCSSERPDVIVGPDDIAYISFTSGSTGKPKGIVGRHGPLSHFLPWQKERFDLRDSDRYSMLSGLSHDPLQRDIFTPLSLGGTICVPEPDKIGRPGWLSQWMSEAGITIANLTPAMMQLLTKSAGDAGEDGSAKKIESLRYAFVVGEALVHHEVRKFLQVAPSATCVNFYGATETQRAVGHYVIPKATAASPGRTETSLRSKEIVPLGKGMKDVQLLVLRSLGQLAGVGEKGEIYVRSPHLARGYLGNEELTGERFLPNPFNGKSEDRLYKTGDLGCYLPDGNVEFLGRNDQQIKIRGFRIEPAEIEATLASHPSVKEAVVMARALPGGEKRLVAYLVFRLGDETSASDLRSYLGDQLPIYMIPSFFVAIDRLPLTPNGKVDRQALVEIEFSEQVEKDRYVEPRNEIEKSMAGIWKEVLGVEQVGVHSNFFELGGHSLLATQIISRVRSHFKIEAPLEKFFLNPTIAGLSEFVTQVRLWTEESQIDDALKSIERMTDEEVINAINRQTQLRGITN